MTSSYIILLLFQVTVGLTSHSPCVTDISGSPPMGSRPRRGRWAPRLRSLSGVWWTLPFYRISNSVDEEWRS